MSLLPPPVYVVLGLDPSLGRLNMYALKLDASHMSVGRLMLAASKSPVPLV